jgi:hypothetical protein
MSAIGRNSKVRCIKNGAWRFIRDGAEVFGPKLGEVCTVERVHIDEDGEFLALEKWSSCVWMAKFFVPIDNLDQFRRLLTIVPKEELEDA